MQLVGERKDFAGYGSKLAAQFFDTASHLLLAGAHGYFRQAVELRREHNHALTEIVLKLSGNPRSFVLVGLHQTLAQTRESEPGKLQIRDVNRRADVAFKAAILEKPRRAGVEDPSIFAVVPAEPILHAEGFTPIERVVIASRDSATDRRDARSSSSRFPVQQRSIGR